MTQVRRALHPARRPKVATALRGAQTAERALDILGAFETGRTSMSTAQIAESVGLTLPTTFRLLKALQSREMVVWDPHLRRYSLGPRIVRLAGIVIRRDDLVPLVEPWLERLREITRETVSLHWRVGRYRLCVRELVSPQPIRMVSGVGHMYPVTRGAAGKAILACLESVVVDEILAAEEINGRARAKLLEELVQIRKRGFATSAGETVSGAAAIAAAVVGNGEIVSSINVTGPQDRFTSRKIAAAQAPLLDAVAQVMRQLGRSVIAV